MSVIYENIGRAFNALIELRKKPMNIKERYLELLTKSYEEAVQILLKKYGKAKDDYYRENSYNRFLNGEIKSITKGKYSRTS